MFPEAGRAKTNGNQTWEKSYALAHISVIDLAMVRINRQAIRYGPDAIHDRLQTRAVGAATQNATLRQTVLCIRYAHVEEEELQFFHHVDTYCTVQTCGRCSCQTRRRGDEDVNLAKTFGILSDLTDRLGNAREVPIHKPNSTLLR